MTGRAVAATLRLSWLTMRALATLGAFDLARAGGFARIHEQLRRARPRSRTRAPIADVIWAVDEACVWYPKRAACLQRSYVATRLLRRSGHAAQLVIGYRPRPFESHAWVEVDGAVVNDLPQYQSKFTVLDRI